MASVVRSVLRVVALCHANNIAHRDIKPGAACGRPPPPAPSLSACVSLPAADPECARPSKATTARRGGCVPRCSREVPLSAAPRRPGLVGEARAAPQTVERSRDAGSALSTFPSYMHLHARLAAACSYNPSLEQREGL